MTLVTGATGFLGAVLVRQLVEAGEPVRILRRPDSPLDALGDLPPHVEHALGDVTDPDAVRDAMRGVRTVYHAAAVVAFGRGARARLARVNVGGTATVVDAARAAGVERLVHTSSIAALGRPERDGRLLDETAEWTDAPGTTAYAASKHGAELEVQRAIAEGLDAVIVNPSVIFGPSSRADGTIEIARRVARRSVPAAPPGGTGVIDVEDVAAGMRAARMLGATGARYVLSAQNLLWTDILGTLADALGVPPPRRVVPAPLLLAGATLAETWGALTGTTTLTRETARTSSRLDRYAADRAVRDLSLTFRPFSETAARIARTLDAS